MKLETLGINGHKLSQTVSLFFFNSFVSWILVAPTLKIIFLTQEKKKQYNFAEGRTMQKYKKKCLKWEFKQFDWRDENRTSGGPPIHPSSTIVQYADDTAVVGLRVCREWSLIQLRPSGKQLRLAEMQSQHI